jgi:V8-like Glu-specific endopeptidase
MAKRKKNDGPLSFKQLKRLKPKPPKASPPELMNINLGSITLPERNVPKVVRDWSGENSYRLVAEVSGYELEKFGNQAIKTIPFERIPENRLSKNMVDGFEKINVLEGNYPLYSRMNYIPVVSQIDLEMEKRFRKIRKKDDKPTNVFGADDRYIYNDSSFPWRTVGRVWTASGSCAGCTIGPRLVLTASHCIDWISGGGAGWVKFSPAYYNGNGPWGEYYATRVLYWKKAQGGLSDLETAFDYVVLVMNDYVGNHVGYPGYRTYSSSWNGDSVWQHMGYPGDLTSGQRPAFQGSCTISSTSSQSLSGQTGYVMGHFNDTAPGHSGGPVWGWWSGEPWPRVVGDQSAAASTPAYDTSGDNEFGGGPALSSLISWARSNYP